VFFTARSNFLWLPASCDDSHGLRGEFLFSCLLFKANYQNAFAYRKKRIFMLYIIKHNNPATDVGTLLPEEKSKHFLWLLIFKLIKSHQNEIRNLFE